MNQSDHRRPTATPPEQGTIPKEQTSVTSTASVIPPGFDDLLASTAVASIATIGPNGEPQVSPVWFDWDGSHLRFGHHRSGRKHRNLAANPLVAVSIIDPANPYRYLEIRGRVTAIEPDTGYHFVDAMAKKYTGADEYSAKEAEDQHIVIVIEPQHTSHMG